MAPPVSRIRLFLRTGEGVVDDLAGTWRNFDEFGCIEDWAGLLSEGSIGGDIIEQDWTNGAIWQRGPYKTYSFDVPYTSAITNKVNPNIWDSYTGIGGLKSLRGDVMTLRREFLDNNGALVQRHQALAVLVTDFTVKVSVGRVLSAVAVFQNLSGLWVQVGGF